MTDQAPRNSGQARGEGAFQRTLESLRMSPGFNNDLEQQESTGDGAREQPHQDARSTSAVSGRRTQEQGASTRRPGVIPPIIKCETCLQRLQGQHAVQRSGCGKGTHVECQSQLNIGDRFHAMMCFMCTNQVSHWLRIVRAAESRTFRTWREDRWFRTIIESARNREVLVDTGNRILNELQNFLVTALQNDLDYWEDPQIVNEPPLVTPTEAPVSPPFSL